RQLLGDYSTIPALAAFLNDKMPKVAAPKMAAALLCAPAVSSAAIAIPTSHTAPSRASEAAGVEGIFREQLQAMTQLINRQFDMLQGVAGAPTAAARALTSVPGPAPAIAPMTSVPPRPPA